MSAYGLEELVKRWSTDQITIEQVIGQILLQLQLLDKRLKALEVKDQMRGNQRGLSGLQ